MKPDYDLSNLETSQADLWLSLRVDAICAQILINQANRPASTTRSSDPQSWPEAVFWHIPCVNPNTAPLSRAEMDDG
jgi:hypothetical protein